MARAESMTRSIDTASAVTRLPSLSKPQMNPYRGNSELLEAVRDDDADLMRAIIREHPEQLQYLNSWGNTMMQVAAKFNRIKAIAVLLEAGVSPENVAPSYIPTKLDNGFPEENRESQVVRAELAQTTLPIVYAAENMSLGAARALIEAGSSVPFEALDAAVQANPAYREEIEEEMVALIVAHVKDLTRVDSKGRNLIHRTTITGRARGIEALVRAGVDMNQKDASGHTPLWYAIRCESHLPVELYIECGARCEYEDVLMAARKCCHSSLLNHIQLTHDQLTQLLCEVDPYYIDADVFARELMKRGADPGPALEKSKARRASRREPDQFLERLISVLEG